MFDEINSREGMNIALLIAKLNTTWYAFSLFLIAHRALHYSLKSRKDRSIMLPNPQPSLTFTQQPRKVDQENKMFSSSPTPVVSRPKRLMQRLYDYLQYGMYSLRYLKQQFFSQNESFVLKINAIPVAVDLSTYSIPNQSYFRLENQINVLNRMDLDVRMIDTHFTSKPANLSFVRTHHSLDIPGLIPWTQIIWYYLRKSNVTSLQDKKIDSVTFFKDFTQASSNEASFSRQYIEKNNSTFHQG